MSLFWWRALTALILLITTSDVVANDHLWTVNVTGGGQVSDTDIEFYEVGRSIHSSIQRFGVPAKRNFEYFGQSATSQCYKRVEPKEEARLKQLDKEFEKSPKDCKIARQIIAAMFNDAPTQKICSSKPADVVRPLADFDGDGKADIRGPATLENIKGGFATITDASAGAHAGDHVFINFNDHGMKLDNPRDWEVLLSSSDDVMKASELKEWLGKLRDRGLTVHFNIEACFSGGFSSLTDLSAPGAPVCGVADADPETVAMGSDLDDPKGFDLLFARYLATQGSQLKAFACALPKDPFNRPMSSLDIVVRNWEKRNLSVPECKVVTNLAEVERKVAGFAGLVGKRGGGDLDNERAALIRAYNGEFASIIAKCRADRTKDIASMKALVACADNPDAGVDASARDYLKGILTNGTVGEDYDVELVNRHLRFLQAADAFALTEFKSAFCCLGYNLKTGKGPSICK